MPIPPFVHVHTSFEANPKYESNNSIQFKPIRFNSIQFNPIRLNFIQIYIIICNFYFYSENWSLFVFYVWYFSNLVWILIFAWKLVIMVIILLNGLSFFLNTRAWSAILFSNFLYESMRSILEIILCKKYLETFIVVLISKIIELNKLFWKTHM